MFFRFFIFGDFPVPPLVGSLLPTSLNLRKQIKKLHKKIGEPKDKKSQLDCKEGGEGAESTELLPIETSRERYRVDDNRIWEDCAKNITKCLPNKLKMSRGVLECKADLPKIR